MIRFGSVCSGIEAASIAWHPLGWTPAWFAEIEPFPSAVLAHHYPDVPNLGDMTTIAARIAAGEVEAPDVLVGGTPCQSFSVAGLRGGLSDARGQLTLSFVELANAIDAARAVRGQQPSIIVWENVPGALSSKDNAFGCFLGALAGEDRELEPAGRRWSNAGCVFGPERTISWRILDAQYFGVAQRRRRAFVIASARDGFNPAEVLFEFDGVRRDSAPSREAGQGAAGTLTSSLGRRNGAPDCASTPGLIQPEQPEGCWWDGGQVSQTLDAVLAKGQTMPEKNRFPAVLQPVTDVENNCLNPEQPQCWRVYDPTGVSPSLQSGEGRGNAILSSPAVPLLEVGKRTGASTTDKRAGVGIGEDGDPMYTLQAGAQHGIALNARQHPVSGDVFGALDTSSPQAQAVAFQTSGNGASVGEVASTMQASYARQSNQAYDCIGPKMQVRRLTPVECERLQGFPDNYTRIPVRQYAKRTVTRLRPAEMWEQIDGSWWLMSADGPRYKALGNSMAVPVMNWIGRRIDAAVREAV